MQLDSLMQSVRDHCTGLDQISVIAHATSELHLAAYRRLVESPPDSACASIFSLSGPGGGPPIGASLAGNIEGTDHVALAVDDMTFYRRSDFATASNIIKNTGFVWSWRLGDKPPFTTVHYWCDLEYHWQCSPFVDDPDYRYLFHTDGALYHTADYVKMLDKWLPYWKTGKYTPNDLEAAVAARRADWAPLVGPHFGPIEPTCITWQLNRVQTKYGSPAAEIPETNLDALAEAYLAGKRVDNEALYAILQSDNFIADYNPPGARPTHVYASEKASKLWASCVK